jgi:hypothetical protein
VHFLGLQQRGCGFVSQVELLRGKTKQQGGSFSHQEFLVKGGGPFSI